MAVYELNQDYKICVRRKMSDCQISWTRTPGIAAWHTAVGKNEYHNNAGNDLDGNFYCFKALTGDNSGGFSNNGCGMDFQGVGCVKGALGGGCNDWLVIPEGRYLGSAQDPSNHYGQNDIYCGV